MSAGAPGAFVAVKAIPGGWIRTALACASEPPLADGDLVVVQTESGPGLASVLARPASVLDHHPPSDQAPRVLRRASGQDQALRARHEQREREAFRVVPDEDPRARPRDEARRASSSSSTARGWSSTSRPRAAWTSASWCASWRRSSRRRIEMRQIGVRDEARMLGGYGSCGRPLCCTTWLQSFEPVSIKMAKQQDLSLEPVEAVRPVRPAEVLPPLRAARREAAAGEPRRVATRSAVDADARRRLRLVAARIDAPMSLPRIAHHRRRPGRHRPGDRREGRGAIRAVLDGLRAGASTAADRRAPASRRACCRRDAGRAAYDAIVRGRRRRAWPGAWTRSPRRRSTRRPSRSPACRGAATPTCSRT